MLQLNKELILASNSPRRKEILAQMGFDFKVLVKSVDESFPADMPVNEVAKYLAKKKAEVFEGSNENTIILTSDTIVVCQNQVMNKPANFEEAITMLQGLSNKTHTVYTGICLKIGSEFIIDQAQTQVSFLPLSTSEINYYIKTDKPFDKAGSYGVQDFIGMALINKMEGSYFTVMGLPAHLVYQYLKKYIINVE